MRAKSYIVEIISAALVLLWLFVAISKLISLQTSHTQQFDFPFTTGFDGVFIAMLGFTELAICFLLVFRRWRKQGLVGSLILLLLYVINTCIGIPILGAPWMILTDFLPALPWSVDGVLDLLFIAFAWLAYWILTNEEEDERILNALFREQVRAKKKEEAYMDATCYGSEFADMPYIIYDHERL